jgi:hypothetical protein
MSFAIIKVPKERLNPVVVRNIARKHWGLTKEQMVGMHVHHFPPRSEGGRDIPEHLYVCSPEFHKKVWHGDEYYMKNLMKAVEHNTGKKQSEETKKKRSEKLKGRRFGNNIPGSNNSHFNKKIKIKDIVYESLTDASKQLNISLQCLHYRMKNWKDRGYEYV